MVRLLILVQINTKIYGNANSHINKKRLKNINWTIEKKSNFKEAKLLKLNSKKANKFLKWKCVLNTNETISMVIAWYLNFYTRQIPNEEFSMMQIKKYLKILEKRKK